MTEHEAQIHNNAINAALAQYANGIGAIKALRVRHAVVVEHSAGGHATKQEVKEVSE